MNILKIDNYSLLIFFIVTIISGCSKPLTQEELNLKTQQRMQEIFISPCAGKCSKPFKRAVASMGESNITDPRKNRLGEDGYGMNSHILYLPDSCAVANAFKTLKAFEEINNTNIYITLADEKISKYEKICALNNYFYDNLYDDSKNPYGNARDGRIQAITSVSSGGTMPAAFLDIYDQFDEHTGETELWLASTGIAKYSSGTKDELKIYINYPNTNVFSFEVGTRKIQNLNLNEYLNENVGSYWYYNGYLDEINCLVRDAGGNEFVLQLQSNSIAQKSTSNFYINQNASNFKQYQLTIERKEQIKFSCTIQQGLVAGQRNKRFLFDVDFKHLPNIVDYWKLVGSDVLSANVYEKELSLLLEQSP